MNAAQHDPVTACPACGETEDLSGTPIDDDIQITCGSCKTTWLRGDPRCKGCGATGGIPFRQVMTRTPRGNQVAVVGHREVVLCPTCDADAIAAAASAPVSQEYVSVFLFGVAPSTTAPRLPPTAVAPRHPTSQDRKPPREPTKGPPPRGPSPAVVPPSAPPALVQPTVRQAIEAYLTADPSADSLAMLMLGRHLGPSSHVRDLDDPAHQQRLREWFDQTWSSRDPRRRNAARDALGNAFAHWRTLGWISPETPHQLD